MTMIFTYPMELFIVRRNALIMYKMYREEINDPTEDFVVTDLEHYSFTLLFWVITMIFGLTVTDLGIVLQLCVSRSTGTVSSENLLHSNFQILTNVLRLCRLPKALESSQPRLWDSFLQELLVFWWSWRTHAQVGTIQTG